jgi:hypothetical protein
MGRVGIGCAHPADENDVHVLLDVVAVVGWPRLLPGTDETITSFHVTSLHPSASKLLLNVEFDDYGLVEDRACGCPLEALGLSLHLRQIRSFGKLVGEGVSLMGSDMVRILEEVLPARFGGSPLDYQLAEEEDEQGFTRLTLVVSPRITLADPEEAIQAVLGALRSTSAAADVARAFWQHGDSFRVRRAEPYITARGKQLSVYRRPRPV